MDKKLQYVVGSVKLPIREYSIGLPKVISRNTRLRDPKNNFEFLRKYLTDEIEFLKPEIAHTEKYSPSVYNPNVPLSRKDELTFSKQLLNILEHT